MHSYKILQINQKQTKELDIQKKYDSLKLKNKKINNISGGNCKTQDKVKL